MKLKLISLIAFSVICGTSLVSQIGVVKASTNSIVPITSPITSVIHNLGGKVTFRFGQWYKPANGVVVIAQDTKTGKLYSAKTNTTGNYNLSLNEGQYNVWIAGVKNILFLPHVLSINLNQNVLSANFLGIVL